MQKPYYVYSHWVVGSDFPFYIGMGTKRRSGLIYERAYRNPFVIKIQQPWRDFAREVPYYVKIEKEFFHRKDAIKMEKDLIKKWGRIDFGSGTLINQTDGGDGVINATANIIKKMLDSRKLVHDGEKLKQAQIPYSITTYKYSVMGDYIESYNSCNEAARQNGTLSSDICMAIHGKKKVVAGFQWRNYKDPHGIGLPTPKKDNSKPILKLHHITKNVLDRYENAIQASKINGISRSGIANALVGISKTAGGYIWVYDHPKDAKKKGLSVDRLDK